MIGVLLATDSDSIFRNVDAAIADDETVVWRVRRGEDVLEVIEANDPAFVILDLQIGNMGGVATCIAIRQEEGYGRLTPRPVGLLLDRADDVFIAKQAKADAWITKPLDVMSLKRFVTTLTLPTVAPTATS